MMTVGHMVLYPGNFVKRRVELPFKRREWEKKKKPEALL